ncbi:MAG: OmpA family protein [Flavobacteriales bacterium]
MKLNFRQIFFVFSVLVLSSCATLHIKDGTQAYENYEMLDAVHHLEKGLAKKDDPAARKLFADALVMTNQDSKAVEQYKQLALNDSESDADRITYGQALMSLEEYDDALDIFNGILSRDPSNEIAQQLRTSCKKIESLKADSLLNEVNKVSIPGLTHAYSPVITSTGLLVAGEKKQGGPKDEYTNLAYTNLYEVKGSGTSYGIPKVVDGVKGAYHDASSVLTADGNQMIITRSNYTEKNRIAGNENKISNTQLYQSTKDEEGKWGRPEPLSFVDPNSMYAHPALSKDGKTLFFSSDQSGGQGGMDLWKTTLKEDGSWNTPTNMGSSINTKGNEVFPTVKSADSLFYSSDSQLTVGGLDILYSVKKGNDWSEPYHMPYGINSSSDDFGMVFNGSNTGYFASQRSGSDQIYAFETFNPEIVLKGLITKKSDGSPLEFTQITLTNLTDGTEEIIDADEVGMFEMDLLPGKQYRVRAEKDGYFAINEEIDTREMRSKEDLNLNLSLLEISNPNDTAGGNGEGNENGNSSGNGNPNGSGTNNQNGNGEGSGTNNGENSPYEIPNIHWDYDQWDIRNDAIPYLDSVVKLLKDNPTLSVQITSHCDSRGSHPYNDALSKKRAKAVVDYLVSKGVGRNNLTSKGSGKRKLLNKCKTGVKCSEAEHEKNRRTEFVVIG